MGYSLNNQPNFIYFIQYIIIRPVMLFNSEILFIIFIYNKLLLKQS